VFAPDVRLEGFTTTDWTRLLALFRPRPASGEQRDPDRPRGGIIAVHASGTLRKLLHTEVGRLRLDDARRDWPLPAHELASRHHASWAAVVEVGTLHAVMDRFGARARPGDDITVQMLTLVELARTEIMAGRIDFWPPRLDGLPIPSPAMVRATLDSVCPPDKTMVLGLFDAGELWTSVAMRRKRNGFDLILGPDEVRPDMGLLAGDWRRDYRHLCRVIEDRAGPLSLGCFAEASTFRALEVDPTPGAWTRAAVVRDVILSPLPPALAIPFAIDAGRAAVSAIRSVVDRVDPASVLGSPMRALFDLAGDESELASLLGFQPLVLLRKLLSRDQ
jgi:hypothetical protein